jgi:hypothetical protein
MEELHLAFTKFYANKIQIYKKKRFRDSVNVDIDSVK